MGQSYLIKEIENWDSERIQELSGEERERKQPNKIKPKKRIRDKTAGQNGQWRNRMWNLPPSFLIIIIIFLFFYCCSITVVCTFSPPLRPTPAKPTSLPRLHPPPWFCPCVLYSSSWKPFSPLSLPPSPLPIIRLFLTSMSLVIFCLLFFFCWLCSS